MKWEFTDLALFDPVRREPANCQCVIEGKRIGDGLLFASWQAREYIRDLDLRDADLLVTDGIRYRLHQAPDFAEEEALEANLPELPIVLADERDRLQQLLQVPIGRSAPAPDSEISMRCWATASSQGI